MGQKITVQAVIHKPADFVYKTYNDPKQVKHWNFASPDWHSPGGTNDLRVGGSFSYRMEARDGSDGFDFGGVYKIVTKEHIQYLMDDGRYVDVNFHEYDSHTHITVEFDAENTYPAEFQQQGWQAILDNFKKYCDSL